MEASLEWHSGYIILSEGRMGLVVRGSNFTLEFGLREVSVRGPFEGVEEVVQDRRGESKIVYLRFAFPLRGFKTGRGIVYRANIDFSIGPYGVSYTRITGVGDYLTLHPPPGSLYNSVSLSQDLAALYMIGRRRIYLMEEDGLRRIILV